jgi:hypothetical protein
MPENPSISVFGIRHHGPGSARSLTAALRALKPDCVLVEGPPEGDELLPLMMDEQMEPPTALLVYRPDKPRQAVYYPFAVFSPEWQALRFAQQEKIAARFMDLPVAHSFGMEPIEEEEKKAASTPAGGTDDEPTGDDAGEAEPPEPNPRRDPLRWLAEAAGYSDGERWWEHMVELRRDAADLFSGIREAMGALRQELPPVPDAGENRRESLREAHMRQTIRAAQKEGFERIAVVCGAWHAPVLCGDGIPGEKDDAARLKGLPKLKTTATWIPWTYGRLAWESGYGAGVESPGWYHHLFTARDRIIERWLTRVSRLLRDEGLDASAAQCIDAVRLAEALAAIRARPLPGLPELTEAVQTVFCFGGDLPLKLVREKLIVGETLGKVPERTPMIPLAEDLARLQKTLRLPPKASADMLELDLRKENDLRRSRLLHRLALLGIPWGQIGHAAGKGTFKEAWRLQWQPELAVKVIEAGVWGNTAAEAAEARARDLADRAANLPELTELIGRVFLCDLPEAAEHTVSRLQAAAAVAGDIGHLMDALPALAEVLRYGNVRKTDAEMVGAVVDGLVARACVGLAPACGSLNDDAAGEMVARIDKVHGAVGLLENAEHTKMWNEALARLADLPNLHGLVAGRSSRLLMESGVFQAPDAARRLHLALSAAVEPTAAAAWFEGFLSGSGLLLVHDEALFGIVDGWLSGLKPEAFVPVLPLLRRTFGTFPAADRRKIGERAKQGAPALPAAGPGAAAADFDTAQAEAVLPLVRKLLGLG